MTDSLPEKKSWFRRLRDGLSRTASKLSGDIMALFTKRKLDDEALEELEELLISADLGVSTAGKLTANLAKGRFDKEITGEEIREAFAADIAEMMSPVAIPLAHRPDHKPHIILVVGVNGTGKTTTIGKLARQFTDQGHKVMLAAGDTFRAAAVEQLQVWGQRTGCPVIAKDQGADSAALAYEAIEQAQSEGADILLIDTAGRLHNKSELMSELQKVRRVISKKDDTAPHDTLLVLDATTGQNAHQQVKIFEEMVQVSGLILTKLDGTARGGVAVALADQAKLPIHAIGVGEGVDDLRPFDPQAFARSLMGLE